MNYREQLINAGFHDAGHNVFCKQFTSYGETSNHAICDYCITIEIDPDCGMQFSIDGNGTVDRLSDLASFLNLIRIGA